MEVTGFNTIPAGRQASGGALSGDFQTFLTMLTVQMRNQDPLNPMNASDFAVQLATFSGVEQQTYTNQLLSAMLGRSGLADMGAFVGMEVRVPGPAHYQGAPISLILNPAQGATGTTLVVRDASGAVVDSRNLLPDLRSYAWDGTGSSGQTLPAGAYSFELLSMRGEETLSTDPVAAYQPVLEARQENGAMMLILPGNRSVDSATVTGLRRPAG